MRPNWGSIIWDLLFEPMTDSNMQMILEDATGIVQAETRVTLRDINLVQYEHGIQLQMNLYYQHLDISDQFSLDFDRRSAEGAIQ